MKQAKIKKCKFKVPTYYGSNFPVAKLLEQFGGEFSKPHVPVLVRESDGVEVVLGADNIDADKPVVYFERRPSGWAIVVNSIAGADTACILYIHDDGRTFLMNDASRLLANPEPPNCVMVEETPKCIDALPE